MLPLLARVPPRQFPTRGLVGFWDLINVQGDPQTVPSLYGGAYPLQRGATAGAEASDGAFGASGWVASGDDYLLSGNLAGVSMAGDWTAVVCGLFNGTTNSVWSVADGSATNQYHVVWYSGAASLKIQSNDGSATNSANALTVSATSVSALALVNQAGVLTLHRLDTKTNITHSGKAPTGTPRLGFCVNARSSLSDIANASTVALASFANVAWTEAEIQRAYRAMQAAAAAKGVTVL